MNEKDIKELLCHSICGQIVVRPEHPGRWEIELPTTFPNGDGFLVLLEEISDRLVLRDTGHTLFQLANAGMEIDTPARHEHLERILRTSQVSIDEGELLLHSTKEHIGEDLWRFSSAIQQIIDLRVMSQANVRRAFLEDVATQLLGIVSEKSVSKSYVNSTLDPSGLHTVDFRIEGAKSPIYLYAIDNEHHCDVAIIHLYRFEKHGVDFVPVGVFSDEGAISSFAQKRFADVCTHRGYQLGSLRLKRTLQDLSVSTLTGVTL